jgi:hypothetical protein
MLLDGATPQHRISDDIVACLIATGLLAEPDSSSPVAVEAALDALLTKFTAVPPGRPLHSSFVTPQNVVDALAHLLLGLMELMVALDLLPSQALAAVFVHARATATAEHCPGGVHQLLGHYATILDWSLKRHGAAIDAAKIAQFGAR